MTCPRCGAECAENVTECPACGVIFARFEAARERRAAAEAEAAAEAARRANIEALANEGAEPEPVAQEQPPPAPKKSRAWIYGFSLAGLFGLVIGLYGGGSEQTPAPTPQPTATEREPERRRPQPVAREGQWFELTGNVIGCLTPVQLQRALDIYKSGDAVAAERQMREYFDDEICVLLDTPMRVHVEAVQGPYARVRKQGNTGTAWIVMPKR